jgi:subtilisin family serine protease
VPTASALDAMIRRSRILIVGARNVPRAAALLKASGARRLLPRDSVWLVSSSRVKPLLSKMDTPKVKLARFVDVPADRNDIFEPLPTPIPYAVYTDPLATPTYSWHIYATGAEEAPTVGPGFPVTVFDSGLDVNHPDFAGRPNTLLLNQQSVALTDQDYHGTMVAATAAAALNGVGGEGVYPGGALRSYDYDYATAASYYGGFATATQAGPSVINMSFGGKESSRADYEAIISTFSGGSVLVAAAGNEYQEGNPTSYPGAYPHVLTVAATDQAGAPTSFSSAGPHVDVAAPGVAIPIQDPRDPHYYLSVDGTSFAAPIVSAAAAEAMTARPMDKTQLLELLRLTARPALQGWNERIGYGILDIPALFTTALPAVDPQEPNDDIDQVAAGQMFSTATAPINGVGKNALLSGRVDAVEDPSDVYRVVVPAKRRLTVSYSANAQSLAVALWSSSARSISSTAGLLASPNRRAAAWRNSSARPRVVYAAIWPADNPTHLDASYTLQVRISR